MRNTQLNQFSAECNQIDKYIRMSLLEAEKNVVLYYHRQQAGTRTVEPENIIQKLDSGEFDSDLVKGLRHVASLWHAHRVFCTYWRAKSCSLALGGGCCVCL
ncbi:TPA: hypothetical protein ACIBWY_004877 [Salmonella enterica subsp. enterica serovar Bullbay]